MSERHSDEELAGEAGRAPDGDYRAFERLVERYKARVVANCRYVTRMPDDAEDLAQEIFVKVFFGLSRFESRSSFRTWLHRIKVNHCLNHLKKREGKTFVDLDDEQIERTETLAVEPEAESLPESWDQRRRIAAVLDSLADTLRIPLVMRDMDQLSYQEIADALAISLSATKMRIKRAREEFRRRYGGRQADVAEAP